MSTYLRICYRFPPKTGKPVHTVSGLNAVFLLLWWPSFPLIHGLSCISGTNPAVAQRRRRFIVDRPPYPPWFSYKYRHQDAQLCKDPPLSQKQRRDPYSRFHYRSFDTDFRSVRSRDRRSCWVSASTCWPSRWEARNRISCTCLIDRRSRCTCPRERTKSLSIYQLTT